MKQFSKEFLKEWGGLMDKPITRPQQNAIHKYFELVAEALNEAGISRYEYAELVKSRGIELPWTKENVKEDMWKLIQYAKLKKERTRDLNKLEVDDIQREMHNFLATRFGINVDFPSEESLYQGE